MRDRSQPLKGETSGCSGRCAHLTKASHYALETLHCPEMNRFLSLEVPIKG